MRLLWIWLRTRELPELTIGLTYVLGTIGLSVLVATAPAARAGQDVFWLWFSGHAAIQLGHASLVAAAWRIFAPERARIAAIGLMFPAASIAQVLVTGRVELYESLRWQLLLGAASGLFAYGWLSVEALRYASQLRRRRVLGLSDTLSIWRFRSWGWAAIAASAVSLLSVLSVGVYHVGLSRVAWLFLLAQVLLIFASVNTWSAFFPPAFYRRMADARDARVRVAA